MRNLVWLLVLTLAACGLMVAACGEAPQERVDGVKLHPAAMKGHPAVSNRLGIAVRGADHGVAVVAIELDGPGGEAGLQIGDVITSVNGTAVASESDLVRLADVVGLGGKLALEVKRGGERRKVAVRAGEEEGPNVLGLRVREVPKTALKALGIPYGLVVMRVAPPADRSRILPGDIILGVNQARISSLDEFNRLLEAGKSAVVGLVVRRGGSDLYVPIETGSGGRKPRPPIDTPLRT